MKLNEVIYRMEHYVFEEMRTISNMHKVKGEITFKGSEYLVDRECEAKKIDIMASKLKDMKHCECGTFSRLLTGSTGIYHNTLRCNRLGTVRVNIRRCNECSGIYSK